MRHAAEGVLLEEFAHGDAVADVAFDEAEGPAALRDAVDFGEVRSFARGIVVVVHIVQADHVIAALEQANRGVAADEAGGAGDQECASTR